MAKVQGEVTALSKTVADLLELKSLVEQMIHDQGGMTEDSLLSEHQQGPSQEPPEIT